MKQCTKCNILKQYNDFYKNKRKHLGLESCCKTCTKIEVNKYREQNPEKVKQFKRTHYENNKLKYKEKQKIYYETNKEYVTQKNKEWVVNNKKKYYKQKHNRVKQKRKEDPLFNLKIILKDRFRKELKKRNLRKDNRFLKYLGIDLQTVKQHIENQFKPGMTWDNHYKVWYIDHIIPLSSVKNEDDLYKL